MLVFPQYLQGGLFLGEASGVPKILEGVMKVLARVLETLVTEEQVGASVPVPEFVSIEKEKEPRFLSQML